MVDLQISRVAGDLLAWVLCNPRSDEDASHGRLRIPYADREMVEALVPLLDGLRVDVRPGEAGTTCRDYIGRLPCGLTLVVSTDAGLVPLVEGGGRDG